MVKLIMLIGIPGSGKSVAAQTIAMEENAIIHSSDSLRKEFYGNESIQGNNKFLFEELHRRITKDLLAGKSVIYDATNLNSKKRKSFLNSIKFTHAWTYAIVIATTIERVYINNEKRDRVVPREVIDRMYKSFNFPIFSEGWDDISIKYPFKENKDLYEKITQLTYFKQDNNYHKLTLGYHMITTLYLYKGKYPYAAWLHDIGKEFTKTFINKNGETDTNAHYYGHENVSSYEAMFYLLYDKDLVTNLQLIQLHMLPYMVDDKVLKEKAGTLYDDLILINKADREAH